MTLSILPTIAARTQPWTTLWIAQPAEVRTSPDVPPIYWAANVQYGNYSQVSPQQIEKCFEC